MNPTMDFLTTACGGLALPTLSARKAVMMTRPSSSSLSLEECDTTSLSSNDCAWKRQPLLRRNSSLDDDEEVSLTSLSSCDDDSASASPVVTFAQPVVTDVVLVPRLSPQDKEALFYSEHDFRQFRRNVLLARRMAAAAAATNNNNNNRPKRVRFGPRVVAQVHRYANHDDDVPMSDLYYTEHDLQRFLDDFVASLNAV